MNEEWIDKFLETLAEDEGTEGRKVALEGGKGTRGYGITTISEGLKKVLNFSNLNADEMSDKDLAKQIVLYNIDKMKADIGEETWNNLPNSMKIVASDQYYNSGKLFDGFKGDLVNGNYENALKNTLDIISANDPVTGENGVMTGLVNRRVRNYNTAAEELGLSQITDFSTGASIVDGKKTAVTYSYDNGDPFIVNTSSAMHSASLKKTDKITSYMSSEAQSAFDLVQESLSGTADDSVNNIVKTVSDTVEQVIKTPTDTSDLSQDDDLLGEKFDELKDPKWDSIQAFRNNEEQFILNNADEIRKRINKDNKRIEETNYLEGHENPQFLDPLGSIPNPISEQEQFNLDKKNKEINDAIADNTSYGQIANASIDQEWMTSWLTKYGNGQDFKPNYNFEINDIVPDKETWDELRKDINPEFWDAFEMTDSLPVLRRTKAKILDVQEKTAIINSKGIAVGVTARLLAAILDPAAWTLAIATDGIMAPAIIMNKASRLTRIVRGGLAAGSTNAAIEMTLASQNPTLGVREVLIAAGAGFVLGGTLRSLRATNRIDDDEAALTKAVDDFVKVKEGQDVVESGLEFTTKGKKRYEQLNRTEQDNYDKIADDYNLTIVERTTQRIDGNIEIKMPNGKDEYIITKDGKVYKCK
jgi:hypothetical protein